MKISTVLDQIDLGSLALPTFQRGYVWNREQVREFMDSLYRRHPVGSLLVWVTGTDGAEVRGDGPTTLGTVQLLLDGQQRITTLYGIVRGDPPKFFDGKPEVFTGLMFHMKNEVFEFYQAQRMQDDPLWIDVTKLVQQGIGPVFNRLQAIPEVQADLGTFVNGLNAVAEITEVELHVEQVTGTDKTLDVVVDIFNRVNSGGTKLSKGDLALAQVCAGWPEARDEMKNSLATWRQAGFNFKLDWFLRCINTVLTGEALFTAQKDVDTPTFKEGVVRAEKAINTLLNLISSRLGLDHHRVLGSRYSIPLLARYLDQRGGDLGDDVEQGKLLHWYVHTILWGRYSGSTETFLNQDLALIEEQDGALDRLIDRLRQNRGDLTVSADDFRGFSRGARFYPLTYMLTRLEGSRDWGTGMELTGHLLGSLSQLQVHHIFPKAFLYQHGYTLSQVNALTNFTFLTQDTNLKISARPPSEYLPEYLHKHPGAVESHWIPSDPELWKVENFPEFLDARRELLAQAANKMLDRLLTGEITGAEVTATLLRRDISEVPGGIESDEEERLLHQCNAWVAKLGLPEGEMMYELVDDDSGEPLAVLDLAWPDGLQTGLSAPTAILIAEDAETETIVNAAGFRFFTEVAAFRQYVALEVLSLEEVA